MATEHLDYYTASNVRIQDLSETDSTYRLSLKLGPDRNQTDILLTLQKPELEKKAKTADGTKYIGLCLQDIMNQITQQLYQKQITISIKAETKLREYFAILFEDMVRFDIIID